MTLTTEHYPNYFETTQSHPDELLHRLYEDDVARVTPLYRIDGPVPSRNQLYLKAEYEQAIGSFKVGTYLEALQIIQQYPGLNEYHFVAASAGNHAQGVALSVQKLQEQGINAHATVYMPQGSTQSKIDAVEQRGSVVQLVAGTVAEALTVAQQQPGFFLHPFNSEAVITGQSRVGYEILDQLPSVDAVFVPAGGGGLAAGVSRAIKETRPDIMVIAVQLEGADAVAQSFYSDELVNLDSVNPLSDGTAVKQPGDLALKYMRQYTDAVIRISEVDLGEALLYCEGTRQPDGRPLVLEPAGALALGAALKLEREVPQLAGLTIAAVGSGLHANMHNVRTLTTQALAARRHQERHVRAAGGWLVRHSVL